MKPSHPLIPAMLGAVLGLSMGVLGSKLYWREQAGPVGRQLLASVGFAPSSRPATTSQAVAPAHPATQTPAPAAEPIYTPPPVTVVAAPSPPPPPPAPEQPTPEEIKKAVEENILGPLNAQIERGRKAYATAQKEGIQNGTGTFLDLVQPLVGMAMGDSVYEMTEFEVLGIAPANGQPGWVVDAAYVAAIKGQSAQAGFGQALLQMGQHPDYKQVDQFRIVKRPGGGWVALRQSQ